MYCQTNFKCISNHQKTSCLRNNQAQKELPCDGTRVVMVVIRYLVEFQQTTPPSLTKSFTRSYLLLRLPGITIETVFSHNHLQIAKCYIRWRRIHAFCTHYDTNKSLAKMYSILIHHVLYDSAFEPLRSVVCQPSCVLATLN